MPSIEVLYWIKMSFGHFLDNFGQFLPIFCHF